MAWLGAAVSAVGGGAAAKAGMGAATKAGTGMANAGKALATRQMGGMLEPLKGAQVAMKQGNFWGTLDNLLKARDMAPRHNQGNNDPQANLLNMARAQMPTTSQVPGMFRGNNFLGGDPRRSQFS